MTIILAWTQAMLKTCALKKPVSKFFDTGFLVKRNLYHPVMGTIKSSLTITRIIFIEAKLTKNRLPNAQALKSLNEKASFDFFWARMEIARSDNCRIRG